uniref:Uncharacterized protein n=1 Tax=Arundo donax TaxID=35708 RepID=A0A0A9GW15_ARUDO
MRRSSPARSRKKTTFTYIFPFNINSLSLIQQTIDGSDIATLLQVGYTTLSNNNLGVAWNFP